MKKITTIILTMIITLSVYSQSPWVALTSGTTQVLYNASFVNDTTGWVVGAGGTILKTTNGTSFSSQTSGTGNDLMLACAIDANTVFAAGNSGTILKTTNGGTTWASITSSVTDDFRAIFFLNSSIGFIGGGNGTATILKTTNGGTTWTTLNTGTNITIYSIYFTDAMTGYACDYTGQIIKTTNGGTTWTLQTSGTTNWLQNIYFTNSTTGYVAGRNGTILKTTNGGTTWSALNSGTTTDLLASVKFLDANTGFVTGGDVGANTSKILKTHDAGATWTIETTSSNRQWGLNVPSNNAAYSCGMNGTIIKTQGINAGINEIENTSFFTVSPNPFTSLTTITFTEEQKNTSLKITDVTGRIVNSEQLIVNSKSVTIDMSGYAKGIYFLRIEDEKKNVVNRKIVKN